MTEVIDMMRIIGRPDGFYWRVKGTAREHGPFATLLEALEDMQALEDARPEPGETLAQAEAELGIADWIDPDTGEPGEEERPRLELH